MMNKENLEPVAATAIVAANRNTNGIDSWLTIQTTIVKAFSWTGSSFHLVASVDALRFKIFFNYIRITARLIYSNKNKNKTEKFVELVEND